MSRARLDKQPRDVAAMFDDVAPRYDLTNAVLSFGQDRSWRRAVAAAVALREVALSQGFPAAGLARRLVEIATIGGSYALGRDDVGRLTVGSRADYVVLDAPSYLHLAYRPGVPLVAEVSGATV